MKKLNVIVGLMLATVFASCQIEEAINDAIDQVVEDVVADAITSIKVVESTSGKNSNNIEFVINDGDPVIGTYIEGSEEITQTGSGQGYNRDFSLGVNPVGFTRLQITIFSKYIVKDGEIIGEEWDHAVFSFDNSVDGSTPDKFVQFGVFGSIEFDTTGIRGTLVDGYAEVISVSDVPMSVGQTIDFGFTLSVAPSDGGTAGKSAIDAFFAANSSKTGTAGPYDLFNASWTTAALKIEDAAPLLAQNSTVGLIIDGNVKTFHQKGGPHRLKIWTEGDGFGGLENANVQMLTDYGNDIAYEGKIAEVIYRVDQQVLVVLGGYLPEQYYPNHTHIRWFEAIISPIVEDEFND